VRPPEQTAPVGDATAARERLGWEPKVGFEALVAEMVAADVERLRDGDL
jgi:GDPmannose 4,6-dehydratase